MSRGWQIYRARKCITHAHARATSVFESEPVSPHEPLRFIQKTIIKRGGIKHGKNEEEAITVKVKIIIKT